jgi:hypothetical protein
VRSSSVRGLYLHSSVRWIVVAMKGSHCPTYAILADVKRLAVEYYIVTGRLLVATGEPAECEAA